MRDRTRIQSEFVELLPDENHSAGKALSAAIREIKAVSPAQINPSVPPFWEGASKRYRAVEELRAGFSAPLPCQPCGEFADSEVGVPNPADSARRHQCKQIFHGPDSSTETMVWPEIGTAGFGGLYLARGRPGA